MPALEIIRDLKWQTVSERRDFLTGVLMYKCVNGSAPNYLSDGLVHTGQMHEHGTRQATGDALLVPKARTQYFQRSLTVAGPTLWNGLPEDIWHAQSITAFKYNYKNFFRTNHT